MPRTGRPKLYSSAIHVMIDEEQDKFIKKIMAEDEVDRSEAVRIAIDMGWKYDSLKS